MPLVLYHASYSPPSRTALLVIRNLKLDAEIHYVDMMNKENMTESYLKMNPQHTIPTLDDDGFYLAESRAIASYLVESRQPGSTLFPKDPKQQAIVNQRLYYDMGTLFPKFVQLLMPAFSGVTTVNPEHVKELKDALELMDDYLQNNDFIAGNDVTVADLSLLSLVSSIIHMGWDVSQSRRVAAWYERCRSLPGFEENEEGAKTVGGYFKAAAGSDFKF